jgi:hypothetical protein
MNCYVHDRVAAVGMCAVCQKGVCRGCVGRDRPRLVCRNCLVLPPIMGFEYRSPIEIGGWPLLHVCAGLDPTTMRPRVARGIVAIGSISVGAIAIGGVAVGLAGFGGLAIGALVAFGGAALGAGLSIGGVALGSAAIGGAAVGFQYAIGGAVLGPHVADASRCDPAVVEFARQWLSTNVLPPSCR